MALEAQLDFDRGGKKRRASQRRRLTLRVPGASTSGEASDVVIRDLSKSGLLIESPVPLSVGEEMIVNLPNTAGAAASVIWASGELYGCQFNRALSDAAVSAALLRSEPKDANPGDRAGEPSTPQIFGARLKQLRLREGLSLVELAKRMDVSRPTIWSWEAGKSTPRAAMMRRLVEVLGVTKDEFYGSDVSEKEEVRPGAPTPDTLQAAIRRAKLSIAECAGTTPDKVRLVIEV